MSPLGFVLLLAVVGVAAGAVVIAGDRRALARVLGSIAMHRGGTLVRHWLYYPRLDLAVDGRAMQVSALASAGVGGHRGTGNVGTGWPVTYVDFEAPEAKGLWLRVRSRERSVQSAADARLAGEQVSTGDAAFDRAFLVQGAPAPSVRAVLEADQRAALSGLGTPKADLQLRDSRFTLTRRGIVREREACERLIAAAAAFSRRLRELGAGRCAAGRPAAR